VRHQRFLLYVTGFAFLVLLVVYGSWPDQLEVDPYYGSSYGGYSPWQVAEDMFAALMFTTGMLLVMLVPSFTFDAITGERAIGTLDQLLVAPISSSDLRHGKVMAGFALGTGFLLITMPFLAALYLLGGIPLYVIIFAYGSLVVMTYFLASLGVLMSALVSRTWQSAVATYVALFLFLILSSYVLATSSVGWDDDDSLALFTRAILGEIDHDSYRPALMRTVALTGLAIAFMWCDGTTKVLFLGFVMVMAVAIDLDSTSVFDITYREGAIVVFDVVIFLIREAWLVVAIAGMLTGLGRHWRPVVAVLFLLGLVEWGGWSQVVSRALGEEEFYQILPFSLLFASYAFGTCAMMSLCSEEVLSRRGELFTLGFITVGGEQAVADGS
jgi:ABC-type transport system involved in multi-copper enzyme maturation permease subunit